MNLILGDRTHENSNGSRILRIWVVFSSSLPSLSETFSRAQYVFLHVCMYNTICPISMRIRKASICRYLQGCAIGSNPNQTKNHHQITSHHTTLSSHRTVATLSCTALSACLPLFGLREKHVSRALRCSYHRLTGSRHEGVLVQGGCAASWREGKWLGKGRGVACGLGVLGVGLGLYSR